MNKHNESRRHVGWIVILVGSAIAIFSCLGVSGLGVFLVWRWRSIEFNLETSSVPPPGQEAPAKDPVLKPVVEKPGERNKRTPDNEPLPVIKFRDVKLVPPFDPVPATPQLILLQELRGHRGAVFDVAFTPDGAVAVTGGDDMSVRLWNIALREGNVLFPGPPGGGSSGCRLLGRQACCFRVGR